MKSTPYGNLVEKFKYCSGCGKEFYNLDHDQCEFCMIKEDYRIQRYKDMSYSELMKLLTKYKRDVCKSTDIFVIFTKCNSIRYCEKELNRRGK